MKYFITGATGFLGGRLSMFLEGKGFEVIKGTRNLKNIKSINSKNWIITEFNNFQSLRNICEKVDFIIHAAGPNAEECNKNPLSSFNFYSLETKNLLRAAKDSKVKKLIYLSTAHVYKNKFEGLINENMPTINDHPYALANLEGERLVRSIFGNNPDHSIILRLSNIFGFPIRKEVNCWMLFINNICKEIVEKNTITIKANPLIKRDFLPLNDFCEIILKLCKSEFKEKENNIMNFGSEKTISLLESAKLIKKIYFQRYQKEVKIILKGEFQKIEDFKFCNQNLAWNNLNYKFENSNYIEIESLLHKCNEYFG